MAKINWDSTGERQYELGIDRGVLYIPHQSVAVPWHGLTSVETVSDTTIEPFYFNGVKYFDNIATGDFQGSLRAFTYPDEFEEFDGVSELPTNGLFVTGQQSSNVFHLSYRTMIGNDLEGLNRGYKIHVLYNLTVQPAVKSNKTLGDNPEAYEFGWNLYSVPMGVNGLKPSSHIVFDTTRMHPAAITELERVLYGTDETQPQVLSIDEFTDLLAVADDLIIVDHGDGTWSATGPEYYIKRKLGSSEFAIENSNAVFLDEWTYQISSSQ